MFKWQGLQVSSTLGFCFQVTQSCMSHAVFTLSVVTGRSGCLIITLLAFISPAASSFSFCRPAVEYRALPEDFKHQLSRRTGGNLTWHDGRGQKTAGGRTVKLLQQPGTEALQVLNNYITSTCRTAHVWYPTGFSAFPKVKEMWIFLLNTALNQCQQQNWINLCKEISTYILQLLTDGVFIGHLVKYLCGQAVKVNSAMLEVGLLTLLVSFIGAIPTSLHDMIQIMR